MTEIQRDTMEMDVLFVGAGPSNLAAAYHLAKLIKTHNDKITAGTLQGAKIELPNGIAILEKSKNVGDHMLSGAVVDPIALREWMPDFMEKGFPYESEITGEAVYHLFEKSKIKFPILPPTMKNHGNYMVSLNKMAGWMADRITEEFGDTINIFPEFPGRELLYDGQKVIGVQTGDKGIDHHGNQRSNFEAGANITAKVTVIGEGPRGSLTKSLVHKLDLQKGKNPQVYGTGIKEIWEIPAGRLPKGYVMHSSGWPLDLSQYGGSFLYMVSETQCTIGFVTALDYTNPTFDPHAAFTKFKTHPMMRKILDGGKMITYGAKTVSEGGYWSMPKIYGDGFLLVGESGGFINISRLKGIHLAIKSGMLAAETIFQALQKNDFSENSLKTYDDLFRQSWAFKEVWKMRNYRQNFQNGFIPGMIKTALQLFVTMGGTKNRTEMAADHLHMKRKTQATQIFEKVKPDEKITFAKLTDVFYSGTKHEENQLCHLVIEPKDLADICNTRCKEEYGNPCQHFCPAQVYEMVSIENGTGTQLRINFSNCVHCKTCDIADPYQIINWVTPEGGGGPIYKNM